MKTKITLLLLTIIVCVSAFAQYTSSPSPGNYTSTVSRDRNGSCGLYFHGDNMLKAIVPSINGNKIKFRVIKYNNGRTGAFSSGTDVYIKFSNSSNWDDLICSTDYIKLDRYTSGLYYEKIYYANFTGKRYFLAISVAGNSERTRYYSGKITITKEQEPCDPPNHGNFEGEKITETSFKADWSNVSGAEKYEINVKKASDYNYSNPVYNGTSSSSYKYIYNLQPGTSYKFQVRTKCGNGWSDWSPSSSSITTLVSKPTVPSNPTPSNGASDIPTSTTLRWSSSLSGGTVGYNVYIGPVGGTRDMYDGQGTSHSLSGLKPNTTYEWRVISYGSNGTNTEGPLWKFMTKDTRKPTVPSNPTPSNGASDIPTSTTLRWSSSLSGGTVGYDLFIGAVGESRTSYKGNGTSHSLSGLKPNTTYEWRVISYGSNGTNTEGPLWRFRTKDIPKPSVPSNPTPNNGAKNIPTTTTLKWNSTYSEGQIGYDLRIGKVGQSKKTYKGTGTSHTISGLQPDATYEWSVVSYGKNNTYASGPNWRFTTKSKPKPTVPSNPTPINGASDIPTSTTLRWSSSLSGGTVGYDLFIGAVGESRTSYKGNGTSHSLSGLKPNTTYEWRVISYGSNGTSTEGPLWKFTTKDEKLSFKFPWVPGISLTIGKQVHITWQSEGNFPYVQLGFASKNAGVNRIIINRTENDGDYLWTIPTDISPADDYVVAIMKCDANGNVDSNVKAGVTNIKMEAAPVESITITSPTSGIELTPGDKIDVRWNHIGNFDRVKVLFASESTNDKTILINSAYSDGNVLFTIPYDFTPADDYYIKVIKLDVNAKPDENVVALVTNLILKSADPCAGIAKPTNVQFSNISKNSATISWQGNASVYNIQYRKKGTTPWLLMTGQVNPPYTWNQFEPNTTYQIAIQAVVGSAGAYKNCKKFSTGQDEFTTKAQQVETCDTPTGLVATQIGKYSANILWNNIEGVTKYTIAWRKEGNNNSYTATVENARNYRFTALQANTKYYVKVKAHCPNGQVSAYTTEYVFTTVSDQQQPVAVTGVSLPTSSISVEIGGTQQLTATISPTNATNKNVTWKSSNTSIATVSSNGLVTGKGKGTTLITVTTADGNKTAECLVTVEKEDTPTKVSVEYDEALSLITPDEINTKSNVFYYYRLTDDAGNPVKDARVILSVNAQEIMGEPSDEYGLAVVNLPIYGENVENTNDDLIKSGQTVSINVKRVVDSSRNNELIYSVDPRVNNKTLHVKSSWFPSKLNMKIQGEIGAEAGIGWLKASADVDLSMKMGFTFKNQSVDKIKFEGTAEGKLEGEVSASNIEMSGGLKGGLFANFEYKNKFESYVLMLRELILQANNKDTPEYHFSLQLLDLICESKQLSLNKEELFVAGGYGNFYGFNVGVKSDVFTKEKITKIEGKEYNMHFNLNNLNVQGEAGIEFTNTTEKDYQNNGIVSKIKATEINFTGGYGADIDIDTRWRHVNKWNNLTLPLTLNNIGDKFIFKDISSIKKTGYSFNAEISKDQQLGRCNGLSSTFENSITRDFYLEGVLGVWLHTIKEKAGIGIGIESYRKNINKLESKGELAHLLYKNKSVACELFHVDEWYRFNIDKQYRLLNGEIGLPNGLHDLANPPASYPDMGIDRDLIYKEENNSGVKFSAKYPIYSMKIFTLYVQGALEFDATFPRLAQHYERKSGKMLTTYCYAPIEGNNAGSILKDAIKKVAEDLKNSFTHNKDLVDKKAKETNSYQNALVGPGAVAELSFSNYNFNRKYSRVLKNYKTITARASRSDRISVMRFDMLSSVFNVNDNIDFGYFYIGGDMVCETLSNDTITAVSDVFNITATNSEGIYYEKVPNGKIKLSTVVAKEDLALIGLNESIPIHLYYMPINSTIWTDLGLAIDNSPIEINALGYYMLGSSIKGDNEPPSIAVVLDEHSKDIIIYVNDNLAISSNNVTAKLNGSYRELFALTNNSFLLKPLDEEKVGIGSLLINATDVAGNTGILEKEIVFSSSDIKEVEELKSFSLYPNPAHTSVTIELAVSTAADKVDISDLSGKIIHSQPIIGHKAIIDISRFDKGAYLVKVDNVVKKLIVE